MCKRGLQNMDETCFITNCYFLIHHSNHLHVTNALFIPAKGQNKLRHSLLEHLLQKSK